MPEKILRAIEEAKAASEEFNRKEIRPSKYKLPGQHLDIIARETPQPLDDSPIRKFAITHVGSWSDDKMYVLGLRGHLKDHPLIERVELRASHYSAQRKPPAIAAVELHFHRLTPTLTQIADDLLGKAPLSGKQRGVVSLNKRITKVLEENGYTLEAPHNIEEIKRTTISIKHGNELAGVLLFYNVHGKLVAEGVDLPSPHHVAPLVRLLFGGEKQLPNAQRRLLQGKN